MSRDYREAENRLRESIAMRGEGFWRHTYPDRDRDLETMRAFHSAYGIPPSGFIRRLMWSVKRGVRRA